MEKNDVQKTRQTTRNKQTKRIHNLCLERKRTKIPNSHNRRFKRMQTQHPLLLHTLQRLQLVPPKTKKTEGKRIMNRIVGFIFRLILKKYSLFFVKKDIEGYEAYYINRICVDDEMNEILFEYYER